MCSFPNPFSFHFKRLTWQTTNPAKDRSLHRFLIFENSDQSRQMLHTKMPPSLTSQKNRSWLKNACVLVPAGSRQRVKGTGKTCSNRIIEIVIIIISNL